jgi:16S rRNA processing protein RimM
VHPFSAEEKTVDYICIGEIVNTFGIRGELKISSMSDFDDIRYRKGNTVYVLKDREFVPLKVASFRVHKGYSMVGFEGLADINAVEQYKNCFVYIRKEDQHALPAGEYYVHQLVGLKAVLEDGAGIGTVAAVEATSGAQNNLRVRREDGTEVLIPYVPSFVPKVDLAAGTITVRFIEGLL